MSDPSSIIKQIYVGISLISLVAYNHQVHSVDKHQHWQFPPELFSLVLGKPTLDV